MGSFNFDEMEKLYTRSVLSSKKKQKRRKNSDNESKIILISIIVATVTVIILFNVFGSQEVEVTVNNVLIDEVVYQKSKTAEPVESIKNNGSEIKAEEKEELIGDHYVIQVLASKDINAVDKEVKRIFQKGEEVYRIKEGKSFYKIIIDKKFLTRDEAEKYALNLKERKIVKSYWVRFIPGKE